MIYDIIIVGAGVAGLYAARHLPKEKKVLIISKDDPWECNTFYAQGGISFPTNIADQASHIQDTLNAGDGLCHKDHVQILINEAPQVLDDLADIGFHFDKDDLGNLLYTKEAAHSSNRILHAGGDATGRYLHHFLLSYNRYPMLTKSIVIDLLTQDNICYGVSVFVDGKIKNYYANQIILASGGVGALYEYHTNARSVSADIQGIAAEKNMVLDRMEMLQFHPTVFVKGEGARKLLLSEALRGEGAYVEDEDGKRFLFDYDNRGELASRDIVSKAIYDYKKKTDKNIYLSFKNFSYDKFQKRFPNISKTFHTLGFNVPEDRVPISPAFHYSIGGIKTDENGLVSGYENLYAIGEVASTRVHGANRLASNSLLEGLVFAKRAVDNLKFSKTYQIKKFKVPSYILIKKNDKKYKQELRKKMWNNVGIVRHQKGLKETQEFIEKMLQLDIGRILQLRLLSAKEIVKAAIDRKDSVGVHFMID